MRTCNLFFLLIIFAVLHRCEKPTLLVPEPGDLSGPWDVYHIKFDETLVRTTDLFITQSGDSVHFLEESGGV